jgi:hypothetical protein
MTPKNSTQAPEWFLCDDCVPVTGRKVFELTAFRAHYTALKASHSELLIACQFMAAQIERLAAHAFSGEVEQWLAKCDALNCGKRAIAQAEALNEK